MYKPYRLEHFPNISYPVLYKAYLLQGDGGQESQYEIANIFELQDSTDAINALTVVYHNYYNLTFNINSLYQVPFIYNVTPYTLVYMIVYEVNGIEKYIWEYLPIWVNIKTLNEGKKLIF